MPEDLICLIFLMWHLLGLLQRLLIQRRRILRMHWDIWLIFLKDAAKTIGSSATTILFDHLIPNALGSILVTITMLIPSAIFMEAFLGYLGIGLQPPLASLGTMCNDASANLRTSPHELLIPALMICVIMFAFNFVGDGLRDALDPKLKK